MKQRSFLFDTSGHRGNMLFLGNTDSLLREARSVLGLEGYSKRRPDFFRPPEEMFGYEYYDDEQSPEKKRRLSSDQVHLLEKSFDAENKLEPERKVELARQLGLEPKQVAIWFQNRRARWKTKQLEQDYDQLKSSYDSLLTNYDSVLKDNEKLRSQVTFLKEKLQNREAIDESCLTGQRLDDPAKETLMKVDNIGGRLDSIVDEESTQLVDVNSGSYFHSSTDYDNPRVIGGLVDMIKPEEYRLIGDDNSYCFGNMFGHEQQATMRCWTWP